MTIGLKEHRAISQLEGKESAARRLVNEILERLSRQSARECERSEKSESRFFKHMKKSQRSFLLADDRDTEREEQ